MKSLLKIYEKLLKIQHNMGFPEKLQKFDNEHYTSILKHKTQFFH